MRNIIDHLQELLVELLEGSLTLVENMIKRFAKIKKLISKNFFRTVMLIVIVSSVHVVYLGKISQKQKEVKVKTEEVKELEKELQTKKIKLESKIKHNILKERAEKELEMEASEKIEYLEIDVN